MHQDQEQPPVSYSHIAQKEDLKKEEENSQQDPLWVFLEGAHMPMLNYSVHWVYNQKEAKQHPPKLPPHGGSLGRQRKEPSHH